MNTLNDNEKLPKFHAKPHKSIWGTSPLPSDKTKVIQMVEAHGFSVKMSCIGASITCNESGEVMVQTGDIKSEPYRATTWYDMVAYERVWTAIAPWLYLIILNDGDISADSLVALKLKLGIDRD